MKGRIVKTHLSLANVGDLANGTAREIINAALNAVASDLDDRGNDRKKRSVTIKLEFCQLSNDDIDVTVEATPKVPAYKTPSTFAKMRRKDGLPALEFQDDHPNPDQEALPGMESRAAQEA